MSLEMHKYIYIFYILNVWSYCLAYDYDEYYFTQKVDHFGYATDDTFQQRFLVNLENYNADNGAILFYTGNEGDITMFANNTGFMWENAKAFNAGLIFAEHRYYGKSIPYKEHHYKANKKLGYLSSEQALADFATLVYHVRQTLPGAKYAPIIAIGGSYGGMLASWMRMKYPHLINGAVASSAPILQFQGLTPCEKFSEIVTDNFKNEGLLCAKSIRQSWEVIRKIGQSEHGAKYLTKTFKLCQTIKPSNVSMLIDWLSETWSYLAMTNYPYPTHFLNSLPAYPIKAACKFLQTDTEIDKVLVLNIFKAASVFHNYTGNVKCNDLTTPGGPTLSDQFWDYQACTEMVQPMCQTGTTDMFEPQPWNFTAFSENCWKTWNVRPDVSTSYIIYGGKNITASSNIVFSVPHPVYHRPHHFITSPFHHYSSLHVSSKFITLYSISAYKSVLHQYSSYAHHVCSSSYISAHLFLCFISVPHLVYHQCFQMFVLFLSSLHVPLSMFITLVQLSSLLPHMNCDL